MFVHKQTLEHLLPPEAYYSEDFLAAETAELFADSWHFVATNKQLPSPGDFLTLDILGTPIILRRNTKGTLQAYLNVCSHRHCMLTAAEQGCMPKLRCQYHGWEYEDDGRTRRIPEAGCFRPL